MRVAVGQFKVASHESLTFASQMGGGGVLLNTPALPGEQRWEYGDLRRLRARVESYGLRLEALENTPVGFYDAAMLGLPEPRRGRSRTTRPRSATWAGPASRSSATTGCRTASGAPRARRPGAAARSARPSTWPRPSQTLSHDRVYTEDEMWRNYEYFLQGGAAGGRGGRRPAGAAPRRPAGADRSAGWRGSSAASRASSAAMETCRVAEPRPRLLHGLLVGDGAGAGVLDAIEYFGARGKIFYVHFRDVQGGAESSRSASWARATSTSSRRCGRFKRVGFTGFLIDDHVPHMVDDTPVGPPRPRPGHRLHPGPARRGGQALLSGARRRGGDRVRSPALVGSARPRAR